MPTLQGLFIQPRKGLDPRIPQTDASKRTVGADGKLYKLVPKNDAMKYRIMDDQELSAEQRRTQELAATILERMSIEQRRKNVNRSSTPSGSFAVPAFGAIKKKSSGATASPRPTSAPASRPSATKVEEKDASVQYLRSSQQQSVKVIEQLNREKLEMEREIRQLRGRLSQKTGLSQSVDDINLKAGDAKPARPASRRPKSASYRDIEKGTARDKSTASEANKTALSMELQADIDRFIRKRREIEEHEEKARREQLKYEEELRNRAQRASLKGHEFDGLMQRQKEAEANKKARMDKQKKEAQEAVLREKKEWEMQRKLHLEKPLPSAALSWRELQELEDGKRKQRTEARKQTLMSMSSPFKAAEPIQPKAKEVEPAEKYVFTADDPHEVVTRLSQQQEVWEARLKANRQYKKGERNPDAKPLPKTSIELRAEEYAVKAMERKQQRLQKAKEAEELRKKKEEEKHQKLLNTKIPDASKRLTNAVEVKIKKLRESKDSAIAAEQKMESLMKQREKSSKQTSAFISSLIKEREVELQQQRGGHVELKKADQLAAEKAEAAKAEYREQLRANRRKIREALKSRPSLIERHDQHVTKREASSSALTKIANAVSSGNDEYRDDIFDDEEKLKLRYDADENDD